MDVFWTAVENFMGKMPYFGFVFLIFLVGVSVFRKIVRYERPDGGVFDFDCELTGCDNPAWGVYFSGYILGLAIALAGALHGLGDDVVGNLVTMGICSGMSIALMLLSTVINAKFILFKFDDLKEMIVDKNAGTAFVHLGSFLATGLMINGVLTGHSDSTWLMIRDILVYWAVGQFILVMGGLIFQKVAGFEVHTAIEKDNVAAGICFGFFLVGQGAIARMALAGAGSDVLNEVVLTLVYAFLGTALLCAGRVVADKVMLPASPLTKEIVVDANCNAGAVCAAVFAAIAVLVAFA